MVFSDVQWIRSYAKKMDVPLKKKLFNNYRHSKLLPCFLHNYTNKIRYLLKRIDVIVKCEVDLNHNDEKDIKNIMGSLPLKKNSKLKSVNCFHARLTPKKIKKLLEHRLVKMIYLDREYKALLDVASPSLNAPIAWNSNITGKGITTAVIDTGIHPHADLINPENRILAFKDFVGNKKEPYDDNGHGTHVAGDIGSNGLQSGGLYKAPAYNSNLVGVKVLNKIGSGKLSTIISGIDWCVENKNNFNIRIICMSLGSEATGSYKSDLLCEAAEAAWRSGIVVCVAAGNEGPKSGTIASPGIDPVIITVGAADDKNTPDFSGDTIADFSSRGPTVDNLEKPDLIAPGVNIVSLRSPGSYLDKNYKSNRVGDYYFSLSGTSMATPICCGSVALLLEKNPLLTPDQVKNIITKTCTNMGYDKNAQGSGYINIGSFLGASNIRQEAEPVSQADPSEDPSEALSESTPDHLTEAILQD